MIAPVVFVFAALFAEELTAHLCGGRAYPAAAPGRYLPRAPPVLPMSRSVLPIPAPVLPTPTVMPVVDAQIAEGLINTLQLFIVSDMVGDTLTGAECAKVIPKSTCGCTKINQELILPPYAPQLPCGVGYLPSAVPFFLPQTPIETLPPFLPVAEHVSVGCGLCDQSLSLTALTPCGATIATPFCPDLTAWAQPVIL